MNAAVIRTAVERLLRREALTARQVYAALGAPHHVLRARGRLIRAALDFSFVAFEYPVGQSKPEDEEKDLGQAGVR